jgi:lysophospholipase L1-like esterase
MKTLLFFCLAALTALSCGATLRTESALWNIDPQTGALAQVKRQASPAVVVESALNHYFIMSGGGDVDASEKDDRVVSTLKEGDTVIFNCVNPGLPNLQIIKKYRAEGLYLRREITWRNTGERILFLTPRTYVSFDPDFFRDGYYLGSGYIGPLIPAPSPARPQKETRYKQSSKGMLLYHDPAKGSFAQYRTALNGKFVFPWFQSAITNYVEKDNYLYYMPRGWDMSLSTVDVAPGGEFTISDSFVFFHGNWYDFMNDIYVNDPQVAEVLSGFRPGPEWLDRVKFYVGYSNRDDLQKLLELVADGEVMVLVDVLNSWADYRVWEGGLAGNWGGFIKAVEMKKALDDIKALSPRIKIGIYNWISSAGITSRVFSEHPEYFMIRERNGIHKNFFPGEFIQNYPTMVNRPPAADFMLDMFAGIIRHLGVDYIYLDETKTFNLIDWERGDLVRDDHWYDLWGRMKELGNRTGTVMFGNGRANPYSDLNFVEARHQLRPESWREFAGMGMAVAAFTGHRPGGRLCLLYWNPGLDYINRVMSNGFIPAVHGLKYQQVPFLTANAEIGKTSILNLSYTPDWKKDPKTELETYANTRAIGGETVFSILNRAKTDTVECHLALLSVRPLQIWEYRIDKYDDGPSLPYGLGEKDIRANYRQHRWREGLLTRPRLLHQGSLTDGFRYRASGFVPGEFRQLVISEAPAGVYSVNHMPCNYFFAGTPLVKVSGTQFPVNVESTADTAEIILFHAPGQVTVNGAPTPVEYAVFDGQTYPVVAVPKGISQINIQGTAAITSTPFQAELRDGKLVIAGTPDLLTIHRDGKLLYCGKSPILPDFRAAGDIELNTPDGSSPVKLTVPGGLPTTAMLVKPASRIPASQQITAADNRFEDVTVSSSAVYTSAWLDARHIQPGMPPLQAAVDPGKRQLTAGTTDKIADYLGHAYAGLLLEGARQVQVRFEHSFGTGGGILRRHYNRYARSPQEFAGIMLDYQTAKGFYRVALGAGLLNHNGTPGAHPWGSKRPANKIIDLGDLIDQPSPQVFTIDLAKYAPAGWTGKVWLSAGTSRVRPGRRLKVTLEHFNAQASAPVLVGVDCARLSREFNTPRKRYVPVAAPAELKQRGAHIPRLFMLGNQGIPTRQTAAWLGRDAEHLYILIEYQEPQQGVANEFEIWLASDQKSWQLCIFDETHIELLRNGLKEWNDGVKLTRPSENSYLVSIPLALTGNPESGEFRFNLCRMRPSTPAELRELSTWGPLQKSFAEVQNFGVLTFREPQYRAEVFNHGKGGYSVAQLLGAPLRNALALKPTVTVLMAGTNDMINSAKLASYEDFEANLNRLVTRLRDADSQVVLVTVPPCIEPMLFLRHKKEAFGGESPNTRIERANDIIRKTAVQFQLPLYDLYRAVAAHAPLESAESLLRNTANAGSTDGVHLTAAGAALLGQEIATIIRLNQMNPERIACLGDSNTFGAGLKGAGTVEQEPYPAVLARELTRKDTP